MKSAIFPKESFESWKSVAVSTLKGKPFEKLITPTFEGIDLQPLYTAEHLQKTMNFSTVVSNTKQQTKWLLAQRTYGNSAQEFLHKAKEQLKLGNDLVVYDGSSTSFAWSDNDLQELAVLLKEHPFYFTNTNPNDEIVHVFSIFSKEEQANLEGYMNETNFSAGKAVVSTSNIHYAGGSAVHELAYALFELSEIVNQQEDFISKVAVQFSIDTNFFMEIAKLRAFRVLWNAFSKAYDAPQIPIMILAENSLRSYSKLDSNVNLLRAGNAAFSAVLGGADIITVHPHDILTGSTVISERIARNVQLVIREETMVNKIMDPSAGSYYVETLTSELIEQAWTLFLTVLELNPDEQSNYILSLAKEVQAKREHALANRKASLIGTNIYANPIDEVSETIIGSNIARLAQPFEQLRMHFTNHPLKTAVVSFGVLKDVKPRADFIQGFLQAGGLNPDMSPVFTSAVDAWHWVKTNKVDYVVVAAKDEVVIDVLPDFLRQADQPTIIDVAGKFQDENVWEELGLNGTIFAGQNLINKIQRLIEIQEKGM